MSNEVKLKKNFIRIGLKSETKLKSSFYSFLYEKHFDWAIILAAFFAPLPYIPSKYYLVLLLKIFIFSILIYYCIRYILTWKELQEYYKLYNKAIDQSKSLVDKNKLKEKELEGFEEFSKSITAELESLGKSFKDDKDKLSLKEYIENHPEKTKVLVDILNKNTKLTSTAFGLGLVALTVIAHLRGTPRIELINYRRILTIASIIILFFIVYIIEMSFY